MPTQSEKVFVFNYQIRIGNARESSGEIRSALYNALLKRLSDSNFREFGDNLYQQSIAYLFILQSIKARFDLPGVSRVYLSDYSERPGSLVLEFSAVVIGLITNYGSIRESADYFAEDIERIFSRALDEQSETYTVRTTVKHDRVREANGPNASIGLAKLEKKVLAAYALSFLSIIITLFFASQNFLAKDEAKTSVSYDEYKISKLISDEIRNQRVDNHLKGNPDTVYVRVAK